MRPVARRLTLLPFVVLVALGCREESEAPMAPESGPSLSHTGTPDITGRILGPDGTGICNSVPEGTALRVAVIDGVNQVLAGFQDITCPEAGYVVPVPPGTYFIRAQFLTFDGINQLPARTLVTPPVTVEVSDVSQDVQIQEGLPLGGGATLDGVPIERVSFSLAYGALPGFGAAFGVSTSSGGWADANGRAPLTLQPELEYQFLAGCQPLLGTRVTQNFPVGPFSFPSGVSEANCALASGDLARFTHNFNRVAVTSLPGDIGGLSQEIFPELGAGYGVQFPVTPRAAPPHGSLPSTQLFLGGLLIGLESDVVLSGVDVGGYLACGGSCRDFGPGGKGMVANSPVLGKTITWRYTDAGSAEAVGFRVTQRSYDAPAGRDYTLFRFTIENRSHRSQTVGLGILTDWDVAGAFGDAGFVAQGGRLMYQADEVEPSLHAGTLMQGEAPPNQGFFFLSQTGVFLPLVDQVAVLKGSLSAPAPGSGDLRYIQSVGPVTLKPGKKTDLWVATVLGEDLAAFGINAQAASDDIERHRRIPEAVADTDPLGATTIAIREPATRSTRTIGCKECELR